MELALGRRVFELSDIVGRVRRAATTARTTSVPAPGNVAGQVVTTNVQETIQLDLVDGTPYPLHIWNTGLIAEEGDILHSLWLTPKGKPDATLVAIYDRTSGQEVWLDANLVRLFRLTEPMWKGLVVAFFIGVLAFGLILAILPVLGTLAIVLPVLLPILTWRMDRAGRAQIAALKTTARQRFAALRTETFA
ncbi:hypothetical protein [Ketogulonicigenium vulgare]|uniref:hypothetical protein n=1 Tax=Ketogulonicigenium vulgare TaxID=92945 RepID=UPI002359D752|nr:hypothetical protein [Ketogulonicigenium vulgare]